MEKLDVEISDIQQLKLNLMKQKRTLETVMYMLFPREAIRDGYLNNNQEVEQRLRRAKERREKGYSEKLHQSSLGALEAENIAKGIASPPPQLSDDPREGLKVKVFPKPK
jgi:hypothetical protein